MPNTMKLMLRTFIILVLMVVGAWLNVQVAPLAGGDLAFVPFIVMYLVYLFIGITVGSMVNPRFTKPKSKGVYFIPVLVFALIGAQWFFYPLFSVATLPWGIGSYLLQFSYLSWAISGIFLNLAFR